MNNSGGDDGFKLVGLLLGLAGPSLIALILTWLGVKWYLKSRKTPFLRNRSRFLAYSAPIFIVQFIVTSIVSGMGETGSYLSVFGQIVMFVSFPIMVVSFLMVIFSRPKKEAAVPTNRQPLK